MGSDRRDQECSNHFQSVEEASDVTEPFEQAIGCSSDEQTVLAKVYLKACELVLTVRLSFGRVPIPGARLLGLVDLKVVELSLRPSTDLNEVCLVLEKVCADLAENPVGSQLVSLYILYDGVLLDAQLVVFILKKLLLIKVNNQVDCTEVLDLLFQIGFTIFRDPIILTT